MNSVQMTPAMWNTTLLQGTWVFQYTDYASLELIGLSATITRVQNQFKIVVPTYWEQGLTFLLSIEENHLKGTYTVHALDEEKAAHCEIEFRVLSSEVLEGAPSHFQWQTTWQLVKTS